MSKPRVRFAPSPTGYLHVGNARTALLNWIYARHTGGTFVIRIEDTDQERSKPEYEKQLLEDLKWLGLDWDEGPDAGGDFGPYRQSERLHLYQEHLDRLLAAGRAYKCFCSPEELDARRKQAMKENRPPRYDNRCRDLDEATRASYENEGRKFVYRFKFPDEGHVRFNDFVRGAMDFEIAQFGDPVIMRGDGIPVFHLANVVDDALMNITHVLRGEDHLANCVTHILLFEAFGYKPPEYAHMSLTVGADGTPLSKRHGDVSLAKYRDKGYLPEALRNYLILLGWSTGTDREKFDDKFAFENFALERVTKSSARFDWDKLKWLNREYLKELSDETLFERALPFFKASPDPLLPENPTEAQLEQAKKGLKAVFSHLNKFDEIPAVLREHLPSGDDVELGEEVLAILKEDASKTVLKAFDGLLAQETRVIDEAVFVELVKKVGKETGAKGKGLYMPVRAALTGALHGPEMQLVAPVLGVEGCRKRIARALSV